MTGPQQPTNQPHRSGIQYLPAVLRELKNFDQRSKNLCHLAGWINEAAPTQESAAFKIACKKLQESVDAVTRLSQSLT